MKRKQWKKRNVPFNNFLNANFLFHVVIVSEELHKNIIASTVCCKTFFRFPSFPLFFSSLKTHFVRKTVKEIATMKIANDRKESLSYLGIFQSAKSSFPFFSSFSFPSLFRSTKDKPFQSPFQPRTVFILHISGALPERTSLALLFIGIHRIVLSDTGRYPIELILPRLFFLSNPFSLSFVYSCL